MVSKIGKEVKLPLFTDGVNSLYIKSHRVHKRATSKKKFIRCRPKHKNQLCSNTAATKNPKRKLRNNSTYNTNQNNKTLSYKLDQEDKIKKEKARSEK